MTDLIEPRRFFDTGSPERTCESFQYHELVGIDTRASGVPFNFHRSDFRGALFDRCNFVGDNFSRCDFIAARVRRSVFEQCDFTTAAIINTSIEESVFRKNRNFTPDIFRSTFADCAFEDQSITRSVWRDTVFRNCSFSNSLIERSTLEAIEFVGCKMPHLDLSQCYASDIVFRRCDTQTLIVDPDYLGSFFFEETPFTAVRFVYRGQPLDLSANHAGEIATLAQHLLTCRRYSEAFNVAVLGLLVEHGAVANAHAENFLSLWKTLVREACLQPNIPDACEHLRRLFFAFNFYVRQGIFTAVDVLRAASVAEQLRGEALHPSIGDALFNGQAHLERLVRELDFQESRISSDARSDMLIFGQATFAHDDDAVARQLLTELLDVAARNMAGSRASYRIVATHPGSTVVDFVAGAGLVLVAAKLAQQICGIAFRMQIDYKVHRKALALVADMKQSAELSDLQTKTLYSAERKPFEDADHARLLGTLRELKVFLSDSQQSPS